MSKDISLALLSLTGDIYCRGPRQLVAFLNHNGFKSEFFFLPGEKKLAGLGLTGTKLVNTEDFQALVPFLKKYLVVGLSGMTDYLPKAKDLGQRLKKCFPKKIFLLGGIAGITQPEELIQESWLDGICFGEGELATLEFLKSLAAHKPYWKTPGFLIKKNGQIFKNPRAKLIELDKLPLVDYSKGRLVLNGCCRKVNSSDLRAFFGSTLWTASSRGCPFRCSYCINSLLPPEVKKPRFYSPAYIIKEIKLNLTKFPFFNCVYFNDESMTTRPKKDLEAFLATYRKEVGLPWSCYVDPFTMTPKQVDLLVESGLKKFKIGLQSGSAHFNRQAFNRPTNLRKFRQILRALQKYKGKISLPIIDIITDVPWSTKRDLITEAKFLNSLPRPYTLEAFSLAYYPGCQIYNRAVAEKIILPYGIKAQNHASGSEKIYGGIILRLISLFKIPKKLLDLKIIRRFVFPSVRCRTLSRFLHWLVTARKLFFQIKAKDPTLLPYNIGRYLFSIPKTDKKNEEKII